MFNTVFKKTNKGEQFWNWFTKESNKYFHFETNQEELFFRMKSELNKIDCNLVFEFSPILKNGKREFVISADGIKDSFPSVINLTKQAPIIDKWKIIAFRQPHKDVTQISYESLVINFEDVFFKYRKNNRKIDLELHIQGFYESAEWTATIFILLDNVLGEYHTEMILGFIDKKPLNVNNKQKLFPLSKLSQIVQDYHSELNN